MRSILIAALLATAGSAATATQTEATWPEVRLAEIIQPVSGERMKQSIEKLVSFGTRHTLSSQTDPRRGIGAAVRWAEAEMKAFGLETLQTCETVTGRRVLTPTRVCNAVAVQRGTQRPNDVVIITGHIDSRVTDVMDFTKDSPGANDDGSGTAAVIEAARVLSKHKFPGTIVYAALSGEEQGLLGGKILADYARAQGWNVVANLNNDIIGNSCGSDKVCNDKQVRVFSEGPRWQGREDLAAQQRSLGGENDSPSRNLSRFLDSLAERLPSIGLDVMQIWRNDRFGRGGDHTEFLNAGYPAVRMSVAVENYDHQHQDVRKERRPCTEISVFDEHQCVGAKDNSNLPIIEFGDTIEKMDFAYLEKVTKLNVAALATLSSAPPPPEVIVEGAVSTDTTVRIRVPNNMDSVGLTFGDLHLRTPNLGLPTIRVACRRTDKANWQAYGCGTGKWMMSTTWTRALPNGETEYRIILKGIRVDDWIFGAAASRHGFESPVASAVPGGAFKPYVAPVEKK